MATARYPNATGVDLILRHTYGLAEVADRTPLDTPVPTCGDWTLGDLVWHMTEVQDFWRFIIDHRPDGPDDYAEPERSDDRAPVDRLRAAADALAYALSSSDACDPAWSWSDDHTVGFTVRRQTHEAMIHHIDALLATGRPLPAIDPLLAADGIDELVKVMLCGVPPWAAFTRTSGVVALRATDTDDAWQVAFGRMTGTSPDSGKSYDLDALDFADGEEADTTVSTSALDLNLWMWGRRGDRAIDVRGDADLVAKLRAVVADSTQ